MLVLVKGEIRKARHSHRPFFVNEVLSADRHEPLCLVGDRLTVNIRSEQGRQRFDVIVQKSMLSSHQCDCPMCFVILRRCPFLISLFPLWANTTFGYTNGNKVVNRNLRATVKGMSEGTRGDGERSRRAPPRR